MDWTNRTSFSMPGVPTDMPDFLEIGSFGKIAISVISDLALPNSSCNVCLLTQKTSIEILLTRDPSVDGNRRLPAAVLPSTDRSLVITYLAPLLR